ncbi:hypothetical protein AYO45_00510 [Gammaproteobacteria bacterium SCGC AG-212-F23]|nr:hypothetical protein AYO45_00510 [Gammaproteobacteria bacterium SCGC AG-212-F23]
MSTESLLPSYTEFSKVLQKSKSNFQAAQVHGLLCGWICSTHETENVWEKRLPGIKTYPQGLEALKRLYEISYHQLSEFSFEFSLLLPDDRTDLKTRAETLGLWCQGFLTGLENASQFIKLHSPEDVKEALKDIIEIAKVDYDAITANDEDETAYFELVEYVRLTVLMIFHELNSQATAKPSNGNHSIH